jgi:hypothetical protein
MISAQSQRLSDPTKGPQSIPGRCSHYCHTKQASARFWSVTRNRVRDRHTVCQDRQLNCADGTYLGNSRRNEVLDRLHSTWRRGADARGRRTGSERRGSGRGDGSILCVETGRLQSCYSSGRNPDLSLSSAAVRALGEAQDYIAALSFIGMQLRILGSSDANISKYNMNRLVEFVTLGEFHDDRHFSPMRVSQNGNLIRGGDDI